MRAHEQPVDELLERGPEVELLAAALAAAAGGAGSIVALEGEAGIGKTTLLAHARRAACDAGMRVLAARGGELERDFAYGVVRQLFEAPLATAAATDRERWLDGAAGLAKGVVSAQARGSGPALNPSAVLHGLYWLSANISLGEPVLLVIDDAHWADDASIAFLAYLAHRVDELPILVAYASRVGEGASDALPAVAEARLAGAVLRPAALSEDASAKLVEQRLDEVVSPAFARACHTATCGNPFLLGELLRALAADGLRPDDTSTARVAQIAPTTIARATLARMRRLGPSANALAFAVAVLGRSAGLRHAAALAELGTEAAAEAADALAAAAILRNGRPLEFIHPIIRTTIYGELSSAARGASHARAARVLADDGAGHVELVVHLLAAEPAGDAWVVTRLRAAAREVLEQAPAAACTYLERALLEPPAPEDRLSVLLELGSAELVTTRPVAVEHLQAVVDGATDAGMHFDAARMLVTALVHGGRLPEAMTLGYELLAQAAPADGELRLMLEGDLALIAQFSPQHAKAAIERLAPYAGRLTGATRAERHILAALAFGAAHGRGTAPETAQLARLAFAGSTLADEHRPGTAALYLAAWALICADELDEAEQHFERALRNARARGWEGEYAAVAASHSQVLLRQGRLAEAETEALGTLGGQPHVLARAILLSAVMHTMVERADPQTWQPFLAEHGLDGDLGDSAMGGMLLYARGHLWLAAGDARSARDDFQALGRRDELSGLHTPAIPSSTPQALALLHLGERDAAREVAADGLGGAQRWNTPSSLAYALRVSGLVTGGDDGIELLRESVAAVSDSQARLEHARSLAELGAALRRAGHRRDAREALRPALDIADRCGALRLAARAREELVASGARPRRTALRGRDALTPSERRVAQLAADGLGNREIAQALFVTLRTVEGHLTQTYSKLDIASRDELPAALAGDR